MEKCVFVQIKNSLQLVTKTHLHVITLPSKSVVTFSQVPTFVRLVSLISWRTLTAPTT